MNYKAEQAQIARETAVAHIVSKNTSDIALARNELKAKLAGEPIAVQNSIIAIFDRKAMLTNDAYEATRVALKNYTHNQGIMGHSFGAQ